VERSAVLICFVEVSQLQTSTSELANASLHHARDGLLLSLAGRLPMMLAQRPGRDRAKRKTADLSTPLRSGRDDKGVAALRKDASVRGSLNTVGSGVA
jgi:hypothetical protein